MPISYQENLTEELRRWVYSWFRQNPRVAAYIEALGLTAQMVEDESLDLTTGILIANAGGATLDSIGSWYGVQRGQLNDEEYRRAILFRFRAARSNGELWALLDIVAEGVDDPEPRADGYYPAAFRIYTETTVSEASLNRLVQLFEESVKLGVGWQIIRGEGSTFTLDDDDLGLDAGELGEIL